jgi:Putative endonuclease segE, GIY-YIG domain
MRYGHWNINQVGKFNEDNYYGFVYLVTCLKNGMQYIGRKNFRMKRSIKIKNRKNRKIKYVVSNWKTYTTSSTHVKNAIKEYGMDNFTFEIIELCLTKGELSYREVAIQWRELVLESTFDDGTPKYYNKNIGAIRFRLDSHSQFSKDKIGNARRRLKPKNSN